MYGKAVSSSYCSRFFRGPPLVVALRVMADGVYKLPFVVRYFSCLQLFRTGAPALVPPRSCDLYCSWCVGVGGKLGRFLDQISIWSGFSAFSPVLLVYQIDDGRIQPDRIPTLERGLGHKVSVLS